MKRLFVILTIGLAAAISRGEPTLPAGADAEKVAQELVRKLRSSSPQENSVIKGTLKIRPKNGEERSVPIECTIRLRSDGWETGYQTYGSNGVPERVLIIHRPNAPNEYQFANGTNALKPLPATQAARPLGGSDFSPTDLGMDFLHWPSQRIIKTQMIKSRWCNVLESINPKPAPGQYARIISWLDKESGGPLKAEAYDAAGKTIKEFEIGRVKKVEGEWQLKDMAIRNGATGSRTTLEFELSGKVAEQVEAGRDSSR